MMNTYIHILRHVDFDLLLFSSFSENDTVRLDWVKCYFSVAISSYLSPSPIFHQSALGVKVLVSA